MRTALQPSDFFQKFSWSIVVYTQNLYIYAQSHVILYNRIFHAAINSLYIVFTSIKHVVSTYKIWKFPKTAHCFCLFYLAIGLFWNKVTLFVALSFILNFSKKKGKQNSFSRTVKKFTPDTKESSTVTEARRGHMNNPHFVWFAIKNGIVHSLLRNFHSMYNVYMRIPWYHM